MTRRGETDNVIHLWLVLLSYGVDSTDCLMEDMIFFFFLFCSVTSQTSVNMRLVSLFFLLIIIIIMNDSIM